MGKVLAGQGFVVHEAGDGQEALERLSGERFDVAIVDIKMPTLSGLDLLEKVRALPDPPHVIVITAQNTMQNAIEAMKRGAYEYLTKPFDIDLFEELVLRAAGDRVGRTAPSSTLDDGPVDSPDTRTLFGESPAMQRVFKAIGRAARSPHAVLISGESGTGKELVARILHQSSDRSTGPFVAVNAAAIPSELLEATLFGHARGAFTGATEANPGKFQAADGGTLFLDEVGEMPLALQAKLLRVLQEKEFYPLGAARQVRVDVRIVAATNRDLLEEVRASRFRSDLFYRLDVLAIELPPLRDRKDDIPSLAQWLLDRHASSGTVPRRTLSHEAIAWLSRYTFPGNVRELENMLVRAATFATGETIRVEDLLGPTGQGRRETGNQEESIEDLLRRRLGPVVRNFAEPPRGRKSDLHSLVVGMTERVLIELALERTRGNQVQAAKLLGINRNTLRRKLDDFDLDPDDARSRR
ncbi:MAG: sigma-54-dependent Fis family transcriptional regulator [Deltaproteobacteria bacterium]|nr:sigma-54-dependent Fis family transcriptional regulator [Deltaproteobacteria bacterium]